MKITTRQLRAIIKEEVQKAMDEMGTPEVDVSNYQTTAQRDLQGSSHTGSTIDAGILRSLRTGELTPDDVKDMIEDFGDDGTFEATLDHYLKGLAYE